MVHLTNEFYEFPRTKYYAESSGERTYLQANSNSADHRVSVFLGVNVSHSGKFMAFLTSADRNELHCKHISDSDGNFAVRQ